MRFILRGRRSIWSSWRMTLVSPRIVNDVSYVMRINHEIHFAWQAQYLVKLEDDLCCSAHCKSQIFQSTLVLFDPKKIEVFFSKKLEVFSLKK